MRRASEGGRSAQADATLEASAWAPGQGPGQRSEASIHDRPGARPPERASRATMSGGEDDRRTTRRELVTLKVEYDDATEMVEDFTDNISKGGTFILTERE